MQQQQAENDLDALWLGMPEDVRSKIEKLPAGIRDSYLELIRSYALSAYKLGARRERKDCQTALRKVSDLLDTDRGLEVLLNPTYGGPWA